MNKTKIIKYIVHEDMLCSFGDREHLRHIVSKHLEGGSYLEVRRFIPNEKGLKKAKTLANKLNNKLTNKGGERVENN